jgi:hypothetical protein
MTDHSWKEQIHEVVSEARESLRDLLPDSPPDDELSSAWPRTTGIVESAEPQPIGKSAWVGELRYSYQVDGEYYSGLHQTETGSQEEAEAAVEGWKGKSVAVRYSPDDPSISVMRD